MAGRPRVLPEPHRLIDNCTAPDKTMNYTIWTDKSVGLTATTSIPVIYIHSFRGNGEDVWQACREVPGCPPVVLVSVNNPGGGLDDELSPWPAPAVWKGQAPYKGQATAHLKWMTEKCMPEVNVS